jgi:hypothetical protein
MERDRQTCHVKQLRPWSRVLLQKLTMSSSPGQQIVCVLRRVKFRRSSQSPYLVTDEYSLYPSSYFLNIRFNIIHSPMPMFSKTKPSFRFHHQKPVCAFSVPHTCYIPHPPRCPLFGNLCGINLNFASPCIIIQFK